MRQIANENYFSNRNNMKYMGSSQFKAFLQCEAAALAELKGKYVREETPALLIGSYVDAYFSGELETFRDTHPHIFKRDGSLKSEYIKAEHIIGRMEADPFFMRYILGQHQVIRTGKIDGVPFKIKMDSYHPGKAIVDIKIVRDFEPVYKPAQGRLNFVEAWGYDIQGAIYQAVEGNGLPFILAAATKETETDLALIQIPQSNLDTALEVVRANAKRFNDIKHGVYEPMRCEHCDYCKRTKRIDRVISLDEFDGI